MIKQFGNYYCVYKDQDATLIKCFSIKKYGFKDSYRKALGLQTILEAKINKKSESEKLKSNKGLDSKSQLANLKWSNKLTKSN